MGHTTGAEFTKEMKKTHTILLPEMLGYHNEFLKAAFAGAGYHLEIMEEDKNLPDYSLPYISGDYCQPALLILGQMLAEISSGKWETDKIAFMEPQTGGACRAGNYYNSMIKSLQKAGYGQIPVISLNVLGEEKQEGFSISPSLVKRAVAAVCYGDLLMTLLQQIRPYEKEVGATNLCYDKWTKILSSDIESGNNLSRQKRKERYREVIKSFSEIEKEERHLIKVGITGEIYIKFSRIGNENLEEFLQSQGCDYRMGGFINYVIYLVDSERENRRLQGESAVVLKFLDYLIGYLEGLQADLNQMLVEAGFQADADFSQLKALAQPVIAQGCNVGDGWLLAGETADLIRQGYDHIVLVHPFGCLVSHVCGRGILKQIRKLYSEAKIQTIEYDYDSTKTLRESRILLGIS